MTPEEIQADLARYARLPDGRAKSQRFEALAEEAREAAGPHLEAAVLLALVQAYEYSAETEKMPVAMGRVLQLLDRHPAEVSGLTWQVHWRLKWMTTGLVKNPAVPLATISRWLEELDRRFRQAGYSDRPVLAFRSWLATELGDYDTAATTMAQAIAAPRDVMADCQACERGDWGDERAAVGDDATALEHWAPVLDGTLTCGEEPHRTLAKALLPLLRTGQHDAARGAFLRGYPLVQRNLSLMGHLGRHLEFCALSGNEARGLEILAEHAGWLADREVDVSARLDFTTGACVLLRRLAALGHGELPVGTQAVRAWLDELGPEARDIATRYDARNGTTSVSERVGQRLRREPLVGFLPLGLAPRLPAAAVPPAAAGMTGAAGGGDVTSAGLDELVAEARRLTELRHPGGGRAWARVTATGQELPADVAAEADRAQAGEVMGTDPAAAVGVLADVAARFAALGNTEHELEALASAAVAAALAGTPDAARDPIGGVTARAEAAFAAGEISPRYYLNVRMAGQLIAAHALETAGSDHAGPDPAAVEAVAAGLAEVIALAERHGQRFHLGRCHDLLARISAARDDHDTMAAHMHAAREAFLAQDLPWYAAYPELALAEHALRAGNAHEAEQLARDALAHGSGDLPALPVARASSLLVAALVAQEGRDADLADAALAAAARWDGISEPDALHTTFIAARAYASLGRHGEAAGLFAQAIEKVEVPYEGSMIAMTRDTYGRSLSELGQHEAAATQFLEAARLLQDDPANTRPHALLAALAAEELQRSGQYEAALPAFLRAADLLGELGAVTRRARCLRSAAWLEYNSGDGEPVPDTPRPCVTRMQSVQAELEAAATEAPPEAAADIAGELAETRRQLQAMLTGPEDWDDEEDSAES